MSMIILSESTVKLTPDGPEHVLSSRDIVGFSKQSACESEFELKEK